MIIRQLSKKTIIQQFQNILTKSISNHVPNKPTWDLLPLKESKKIKEIDVKKLEKLSMLTIDEKIEKDLNDAVNVVERMCNARVEESTKSLIHLTYLGNCMLREDDEKLSPKLEKDELLSNASFTFDDYFLAPSTSKPSN